MNSDKSKELTDYERRIHAEMLDSFDEELEMEIDEKRALVSYVWFTDSLSTFFILF